MSNFFIIVLPASVVFQGSGVYVMQLWLSRSPRFFFSHYMLLCGCQPVYYCQCCSLMWLRYSHNLFASPRGRGGIVKASLWQGCWTSVHDITLCYASFSVCFTSCYVVLLLFHFISCVFLCDRRAAFVRVSSHQECVHIQANIMLRLFSAKRVTCFLHTHNALLLLVYWTASYASERMRRCYCKTT